MCQLLWAGFCSSVLLCYCCVTSYHYTHLSSHASVGQKSKVLASLTSHLEVQGKNLLPTSFRFFIYFSFLPSYSWSPLFLAGCQPSSRRVPGRTHLEAAPRSFLCGHSTSAIDSLPTLKFSYAFNIPDFLFFYLRKMFLLLKDLSDQVWSTWTTSMS